ncbi:fumarylpyruvate hydrolase [Roseivivax halotolerans]|uniref:Fumarylpyruvate hydrolase n=1 Tax=Roseivivax halotolerans TaxID=93684 RepID=A0A1I5WYK7_9RHOB|nr:fumarylacetoacetate hydrolase family protein [Roseivivax halotolerans]SFQ24764.1 fumarylpyruvate hydrolase [Roseivivax halotolerans]
MSYIFDPERQPSLEIHGQAARFPLRRIFCVGRNYAAHAAEMGNEVDREAPFYFTKSPHHAVGSGSHPMPPRTEDYHHEVEFVVALHGPVDAADPMSAVFGYAVGLDMTRRDLQAASKAKGRPWSTAKDVEASAVIGPLTAASEFGGIGAQVLSLTVNDTLRQEGALADMVWSVPEILNDLNTLYALGAGDIVMTGTPSGVGAVARGDVLVGTCEGLEPVRLTLT